MGPGVGWGGDHRRDDGWSQSSVEPESVTVTVQCEWKALVVYNPGTDKEIDQRKGGGGGDRVSYQPDRHAPPHKHKLASQPDR